MISLLLVLGISLGCLGRAASVAGPLLIVQTHTPVNGPGSEQPVVPSNEASTSTSTPSPKLSSPGKEIRAKAATAYGQLPLPFEANYGQTNERVKFLSRGPNFNLFLTATSADLVVSNRAKPTSNGAATPVRRAVLRMMLAGANSQPKITGRDELPGRSNYFIGNDPKKWRTNVANYGQVKYEGVYPGIDLIYYGNQRQIEHDFVVAPGADPHAIKMTFQGAHRLYIDRHGDLAILVDTGVVRQSKPVVYQEIGGYRSEIGGRYVIGSKRQVSIEVCDYDPNYPLVIDPVLTYSSYLGGTGTDQGYGIAVDATGSAYVTGNTDSADFPTAAAIYPNKNGSTDIFITKLNPMGTALVYSTYIGGSGSDFGRSVAVDSSGNAYLTGHTFTWQSNFPLVNALQPNFGGPSGFIGGTSDAFVTKLNANGDALLYSTYLGGSSSDFANSIAVDSSQAVYVMGSTLSSNFPTANPLQATYGGSRDVFVTKINPTGTALEYSTYLGGSGQEYGDTGLAVDAQGAAYVVGMTSSTNFPTVTPIQNTFAGTWDMFVSKIGASGAALEYSTYLGGTGDDRAYGVAVDASGSAYVVGLSNAFFPTANALQPFFAGGVDAVALKLNPAGTELVYSTYLGGSGVEYGYRIAVDASGNAYLTGITNSTNFPTAIPLQATQADGGAFFDGFMTKLSPAGMGPVFSSYLGGAADDYAYGIAVDTSGDAYVTGYTSSTNFATAGPFQATNRGLSDAYVLKITGLLRYSLGGRLTDNRGEGISGAAVAVSGTESFSTQTDADGYYSFPSLAPGGNFTVTPAQTPYTFVPANQTFNNLSGDQTADFTVLHYDVSGRITDGGGNGVDAATVDVAGFQEATTETDANGYYAITNLAAGGGYTLTPAKTDPLLTYSFAPTSRSYSPLNANQIAANFSATTTYLNTLYPTADSYVQDGTAANTNFGAATPLKLQTDNHTNSGKNLDGYLKFDLSGVGQNITVAKLRIYAALSATGSLATSAYGVTTTSWIESGTGSITWTNKPARNASAITGATVTVSGVAYAVYDLDVTSYVKSEKTAGRDVISLALHNASTSTPFISLASREDATNKPQLIVTTGNTANVPPTVTLTGPANGASFTSPANITVAATAIDTDGTVSKVDFFAGTTLLGTATTSPYQITWSGVAVGSYSLTAVATDNFGAVTSSSVNNITVNPPNNPPAVNLTSPLDNSTFAAGSSIPLSATASDSDGTISKVEFFAGSTLLGTATTPGVGSSYSVTWNNVAAGAQVLTAKATDNASGATTSSAVNITIVSQTGFAPTADAYVKDGSSASTNFGTAVDLQTQASATAGLNRESYLKFDLTSVTGVTKAKLRLYGRLSDNTGTNVPAAAYSVASTTWIESGSGSLTWSNKPPAGTTPLATSTITNNVARWYEWDVTAYVKSEKTAGRSVMSFAVKDTATSSPYATFNSKEATTNRPQLVLWTTQPRNVLLVVGSATLNTGDSAAKTRLENLGFTVTVKAAGSTQNTAVNTSDANGKALVVVSSTVTPANVAAKFRNVSVPVVNWEFDLLDDFGMTGTVSGTDYGTTASQTQLAITNAAHPMAANLSGNVTVAASGSFTWGKPNANAVKIAALTTDATKAVIFGYDTDIVMPGLDAPARRVSIFLTDTTAASFATNPNGGALFDAAIKWAAETITAPTILSLTPTSGPAGTSVTLNGLNFGASQGTSMVTFNGLSATVSSWSDRNIVTAAPALVSTGPVIVTVGGLASNAVTFAVGDTDVDGDGLPDWWELQYFGNLGQGANTDTDGDGLTNLQEYQQGRNPTKSALADAGDFVNLKVHTPLSPSIP